MSDSEINSNDINYKLIMSGKIDDYGEIPNGVSIGQIRNLLMLIEDLKIKFNKNEINESINNILEYITILLFKNGILSQEHVNEGFKNNEYDAVNLLIEHVKKNLELQNKDIVPIEKNILPPKKMKANKQNIANDNDNDIEEFKKSHERIRNNPLPGRTQQQEERFQNMLKVKRDKHNEAMNILVDISKHNKELVRVGWMNSIKAFEAMKAKKLLKAQQKNEESVFEDLIAEEKDISNDGIPDIIISNKKTGMIVGINGNAIVKSKYPQRRIYYEEYPKPEERLKKIYVKGQKEPIINNEAVSQSDFEGDFKKIKYNPEKQQFEYAYEYKNEDNKNKFDNIYERKDINAWALFNQIISPIMWNYYKQTDKNYSDLAKQDKLAISRIYRMILWNRIKQQVYNQLNVEPQEDPKKKQKDEKHPVFKRYLEKQVYDYAQMNEQNLINTIGKIEPIDLNE